MSDQRFERMPALLPLWLAALRPKPGLAEGAEVPRIGASTAAFSVDPAWLRAYGRVAGVAIGDALPATVPQAAALPLHMAVLTAAAFPLPLLGAVHVRQRIEVIASLPVDARFAIACRVEGSRRVRRGVEVELITEVDFEGRLCWRSVTTFLSQVRAKAADKGAPADAAAAAAPTGPTAAATDPAAAADPEISAIWRLPEDLGRRFAQVAGDRNPIHLHALTARPFGFKRPIIHGMWTLARALAALDAATPPAGTLIHCRFRRPLPLPGSARVAGWRLGSGWAFDVRDGKGRVAVEGGVERLA